MDKFKKRTIQLLNKLPYIRTLRKLLKQYEDVTAYPPGHYYSPIPDIGTLENEKDWIFNKRLPEAIELNEQAQLEILNKIAAYYKEFPFSRDPAGKYRYTVPSSFFTYTDGLVLYSFLRHFKPKQLIEVGSGYSSALMMDVNQYYCEGKMQLTFIDPDFTRLNELKKPGDEEKYSMISQKVQSVNPELFLSLSENDLLFIDSSHVSKTGSELNYLIFEILPKLKKGVLIHFHDVYYPFEYLPELVLKEKLAWNEIYLLRAFLMYNPMFEIVYFNNFIFEKHPDLLKEKMPECMKDEGASLYIRKIQ